jgi:uncharacterized repeat protein (TIGR01451 family)
MNTFKPKRLFTKLTGVFLGSVIAVAGVVIVSCGAVLAWGPDDRPTFLITSPADYVVFNSITNQTPYGDERNFVVLREAGTNNKYTDEVAVTPGKEYEVYVHFHNNARASLNASGAGLAKNTKLRIHQNAVIKSGEKMRITGTITADNSNPKEVWDEAYLTSKDDVALRYVQGSATIHSLGAVDGQKLPDELFGNGTFLGYDSLNGQLPGCNEFSGYVTYRMKVDQPNFTVTKQLRLSGEQSWVETVKATPGQKVEYLVGYKNTGTVNQDNVVVKDKLPANTQYVTGTTRLKNSNKPNGETISDNISTTGVNIGTYTPGSNAYVYYTLTMPTKDKLVCGTNKIRNIVEILTDNGNKSDAAEVTIDVQCKPEECKPGIPKGDNRCVDKKECKPGIPEGDDRCADVATPVELPSTGPAQTALVLASLTGVAALVVYEVQKRRKARLAFASHIAEPTQGLLEDGTDDDSSEKLYIRRDDTNTPTENPADASNNNPFSGGGGL